MNKNDTPIDVRDMTLPFGEFEYKDYFEKIADIIPNYEWERLDAKSANKEYYNKKDVLYLFVIDGYIQKVGSSTSTMKGRIRSYNCGKKAYREAGTCSTTNYFVMQSFLHIGKNVEVYAFYPKKEIVEVDLFGTKVEKEIGFAAKEYEKHILKDLKERGTMPILCQQT